MSSSDFESSENNEETKLTVLIVSEGDVLSSSMNRDLNICGTLERHNTRGEPLVPEIGGHKEHVDNNFQGFSSDLISDITEDNTILINENNNTMKQSNALSLISNENTKRNTLESSNLEANISACSSKKTEECEESIVFDSKMVLSSTCVGELVGSWSGQGAASHSDPRRLRKSMSWCAEPQQRDDGSSEVRLLRERLLRTQSRPQPTAVKHLTHRQRMTLVSLALVDFMSFCSMSIMAPFFPREASDKGMSETVSGFVFGFYALVMFLSSPVFGKILPFIGAKFLFMSGMFVAGVCNILFGTLELMHDRQIFTVFCFVIRGLEALGASAYSTASYVFVVNTFPNNIGSVLGILETFVGLGMSIGPAIGGLLYSVGGFGLPFYVLGVAMVLAVPVNCCLLIEDTEYAITTKSGSVLQLLKIPSVIITGLVIVVVSNVWAFLDPTLEPHLRQFGLSTQQIGLIFLLFSALYGIFSPIWGWLADRVDNHWCMMVWGLLLCTVGLLLLGPCPYIPWLTSELWLNLVALSILGISVALTLLPTFQGVLTSSIYEGGCEEALATYSVVAGVWSCCYSLGEVLGPALGAAISSHYTFPLCATIMAAMCFTMAVVTLTFFSLKDSGKLAQSSASLSGSLPFSEATWMSHDVSPCGTDDVTVHHSEDTPLVSSYREQPRYDINLPSNSSLNKRKKSKSVSASISEAVSYVFMFKFLTESITRCIRTNKTNDAPSCTISYQNYSNHALMKKEKFNCERNSESLNDNKVKHNENNIIKNNKIRRKDEKRNEMLKVNSKNEEIIQDKGEKCNSKMKHELNVSVDEPAGFYLKKNGNGLVPRLSLEEHQKLSTELLQHNWDKVKFVEENQLCDQDAWCGYKDVTNVRGTISMSHSGACEV